MEPSSPEPSMEDILASIKRIIAEDGDAAGARERAKPPRRPISFADEAAETDAAANDAPPAPVQPPAAEPPVEEIASDNVLELTRMVATPAQDAALRPPAVAPPPVAPPAKLVSENAAVASRQALAALSAMVVKPEPEADNTLEGMVREMLRPVLKEWLDARLPDIVERLVAAEISRITGRGL